MAKPKTPKTPKSAEISITELQQEEIDCCIVGKSPLIMNRMAEKAKRELLYPKGRKKGGASRGLELKHNPIEEYRNSAHRKKDGDTALFFPSPAFKNAMATTALEMPDVKKTQIARMVWVIGQSIEIFGTPQLFMTTVRTADMNRTPDIRTRLILPEWACRIKINYTIPQLNAKSIVNLLAAAGTIIGIGDDRQEKGRSNFGQFDVVTEDDPRYRLIVDTHDRKDQEDAIENPDFYDEESAEMFNWFQEERIRRGAA